MRGGSAALTVLLFTLAACSTFGGTDEPAAGPPNDALDAGADGTLSPISGTPATDASDAIGNGKDAGSRDGSTSATPDFTLAMTPPSVSTSLGTTTHYTVTVTSSDGFAGTVSLSTASLPATWTASLAAPSVTLAAGEQQTVDLAVTVPTDAIASTASVRVHGAGLAPHDAAASLAIANELLIDIADGTGAGDHHFPGLTNIRLGTKVRFATSTSTAGHRIHSDGGGGFLHQPPPSMSQGMEYAVTPTDIATYGWYCHDHPTPNNNLVVK